ncbi:DUF485 domain-containing protein [Streptomyces sp. NPDC004609]|uniref:DUF485 domain-containing protein n=1 Tax=Streptomyces sp. NPDC004609 TaxID=3364704 RepID=UPI0036923745
MEKQEGQDAAAVRLDDPWDDARASGWGEPDATDGGADARPGTNTDNRAADDGLFAERRCTGGRLFTDGVFAGEWSADEWSAGEREADRASGDADVMDIYLEVQRSAAFQEVRSRYRRFVVPAALAFLLWYLAYVVAATAAPGLMARPVAGAVNVAMLAGLAQFLTTFLLTWAYSRHARLRRDRAALDLRWTVFDRARLREPSAARTCDVRPVGVRPVGVRPVRAEPGATDPVAGEPGAVMPVATEPEADVSSAAAAPADVVPEAAKPGAGRPRGIPWGTRVPGAVAVRGGSER